MKQFDVKPGCEKGPLKWWRVVDDHGCYHGGMFSTENAARRHAARLNRAAEEQEQALANMRAAEGEI